MTVQETKGELTRSYEGSETTRAWFLIDAQDKVLGRLATRIAILLRGKDNPRFTPHADVGAGVVVINAEKIRLTGKKMDQKTYFRHSTDPGHGKNISISEVMETSPEKVLASAVNGMLPHTIPGRKMRSRLKIYKGPNHPHLGQKPQPKEL